MHLVIINSVKYKHMKIFNTVIFVGNTCLTIVHSVS